ncbi:MAG: hypothetical protein ABI837_03010, partial [Acidobacteriota bacterium]
AGLFRPELKITEEYDLFLRIACSGFEFGLIDAPLLRFRVHESNASWDMDRTRLENLTVLGDVLRVRPELVRQLGRAVIRIRLAGFALTADQGALLTRPWNMLRARYRGRRLEALADLARNVMKLAVSFLPSAFLARLLAAISHRRRRAAI